jgi:hypothetical protein
MFLTRSLPAIVLAATISLPAMAADLKPIQSQAIDLGPVAGDAFYTVEHDGYHVIATLAPREGGTPVRVQALLAPGQSVVFSTPRAVGEQPSSVTIQRQDDKIVVSKAALTD